MARWEYLRVVREQHIELRDPSGQVIEDHTVAQGADPKNHFHHQHQFFIQRAGSDETEKRRGWESGATEGYTRLMDLLDELGADGWELIGETTTINRLNPIGTFGWTRTTVSQPLAQVWTFKRPSIS
jgi:hypothetical protein